MFLNLYCIITETNLIVTYTLTHVTPLRSLTLNPLKPNMQILIALSF